EVKIPESLRALGHSAQGRAWLDTLPAIFDQAVERWSLRLGRPYTYAYASLAMPARLPDGTEAVLKLAFPHRESRQEAEALRHWDGEGALRLLAHDPDSDALLLERCTPGTPLSDAGGDEALAVLTGLLPRLWKPAGPPFTRLSEEAAWWAGYLEERWETARRPFPRSLLEAALNALDSLPGSQGQQVLVNQDLNNPCMGTGVAVYVARGSSARRLSCSRQLGDVARDGAAADRCSHDERAACSQARWAARGLRCRVSRPFLAFHHWAADDLGGSTS